MKRPKQQLLNVLDCPQHRLFFPLPLALHHHHPLPKRFRHFSSCMVQHPLNSIGQKNQKFCGFFQMSTALFFVKKPSSGMLLQFQRRFQLNVLVGRDNVVVFLP